MVKNEYKINDEITLTLNLEDGKTNIIVKNKLLTMLLDQNFSSIVYNIKKWVENNYDSEYLEDIHSLPILQALHEELGNEIALKALKEIVLKKYGLSDYCEHQNMKQLGYLNNISREDIIKHCLCVEERSLLKEIISNSERNNCKYKTDYEYTGLRSYVQNPKWRYFGIRKNYVSLLDFDLIEVNCDLFENLNKFKNLECLILHVYTALPNKYKTIGSVKILELKLYSEASIDLQKIVEIFPNLQSLRIERDIGYLSLPVYYKNPKALENLKLQFFSISKDSIRNEMESVIINLKKKGVSLDIYKLYPI